MLKSFSCQSLDSVREAVKSVKWKCFLYKGGKGFVSRQKECLGYKKQQCTSKYLVLYHNLNFLFTDNATSIAPVRLKPNYDDIKIVDIKVL